MSKLIDEYREEYFTGTNTKIYFENTYMDDIYSLNYSISTTKEPSYGAADKYFRFSKNGRLNISGAFIVNFHDPDYINNALNKSTKLKTQLKQDHLKMESIRRHRQRIYNVENTEKLLDKYTRIGKVDKRLLKASFWGLNSTAKKENKLLNRFENINNDNVKTFDIYIFNKDIEDRNMIRFINVQILSYQQIINIEDARNLMDQYTFIAQNYEKTSQDHIRSRVKPISAPIQCGSKTHEIVDKFLQADPSFLNEPTSIDALHKIAKQIKYEINNNPDKINWKRFGLEVLKQIGGELLEFAYDSEVIIDKMYEYYKKFIDVTDTLPNYDSDDKYDPFTGGHINNLYDKKTSQFIGGQGGHTGVAGASGSWKSNNDEMLYLKQSIEIAKQPLHLTGKDSNQMGWFRKWISLTPEQKKEFEKEKMARCICYPPSHQILELFKILKSLL